MSTPVKYSYIKPSILCALNPYRIKKKWANVGHTLKLYYFIFLHFDPFLSTFVRSYSLLLLTVLYVYAEASIVLICFLYSSQLRVPFEVCLAEAVGQFSVQFS
jgi:hypothetical protein